MLTDVQIWDLSKKMGVPLVFCNFKSQLTGKLKYNKSYVINMQDALDKEGQKNEGSHYTAFQVNKYANGKTQAIYFDSFGCPPPLIIEQFCKIKLAYNHKDIQSIMNSACGWYCMAFLHYINAFQHRTKDLYSDAEHFTDLFEDLSTSSENLKNEFILKHFFQSSDPSKRISIEVDGVDTKTIISEDEDYKKTL
jgi:hypothetical protein